MSANNQTNINNGSNEPKLRHAPAKGATFEQKILAGLGLLSAFMLGISLHTLNTETGPLANLKMLLITAAASLAAYGINRVSIEKLAPRAAIGFRLAIIVAVLGIGGSGVGMFIGSFSGIALPEVEFRVLDENSQAQVEFIGAANDSSLYAQRMLPVVRGTAGNLVRTAACEAADSCLSRQGNGGRGTIAIALEGHALRAQAIADAMNGGSADRDEILRTLNDLSGRYQAVLADADQSNSQKRVELQSLHGQIQQSASALREALPLTLLATFADELRAGATVPGNPQGSQRLTFFLRDQGEALQLALRDIPVSDLTPPPFPQRPGMLDTLRYIPDFAAIAAVIAIAELFLPMALFVTAYLTLVWEIEKRTPPKDDGDDDGQGFDGLIELPPMPSAGKGQRRSRRSRSRNSRGRS